MVRALICGRGCCDIVAFDDYANTWACNAVTICRAGEPINGGSVNAVLDVVGQSVTLVYVDATRGWAFKTNTA